MSIFSKRINSINAIREALDNLPDGLCFFDKSGLPVLCNRQMHRLSFRLSSEAIHTLPVLQEALTPQRLPSDIQYENSSYILPDGSAWSFSFEKIITESGAYTQVTAFEVSELRQKQELLKKANEAKNQTISALEHIEDNIIDITREEELLAMKMQLHNQFGYNLQTIRRFFENGCSEDEKAEFVESQRDMLRKLAGDIDDGDEADAIDELKKLVSSLDMNLIVNGELPQNKQARTLLVAALRENLINTVSHAGGRKVVADLVYREGYLTVTITNDGKQPEGEIVEGGGLSSLRKMIESAGGQMLVSSKPRFELVLTVRCEV